MYCHHRLNRNKTVFRLQSKHTNGYAIFYYLDFQLDFRAGKKHIRGNKYENLSLKIQRDFQKAKRFAKIQRARIEFSKGA